MLNDLSFLQPGMEWVPETEKTRIALYDLNHALYINDHLQVLDVLLKVVYPEQEVNETVKRVFVNLYRSVSKTWADLLFSENPSISKADKNTENYLNELIKSSRFWKTSKKVAIDASRYGTGLYKIRVVEGKAVIEAISPRMWFPVVNPDNINDILYHVLAYSFVEGKVQYLKVEVHSVGKIEHKLFIIDKNSNKIKTEVELSTLDRYKELKPIENTNVDDFLVIPVNNASDSENAIGEDDYTDINPLISQIELQLTKYGKDLEEQGNLKYGPATAINKDGQIERNSYIPMLGGANQTSPPGVVTWTVQHEAIKEYISQLMFFFYMLSAISPVLFDPNQTVSSDISGVALKRLMQKMLSKAGGLAEDFDESIKRVFAAAAQLEGKTLSDYSISWQDGLVDDINERAETAQKAGATVTMSQKTAVAYVQQIEGEALDTELKQIEEEQKNKTVLDVSDLYPNDGTGSDKPEGKDKENKEEDPKNKEEE